MERKPAVRELFIEELAEVTGGVADPLQKVKDALVEVRDYLMTTYGCGEELIDVC